MVDDTEVQETIEGSLPEPDKEVPEKSLRDQITDAMTEVKEAPDKKRDEGGKFAKKEQLKLDTKGGEKPAIGKAPIAGETKEIPAPASWKAESRQKWAEIPADIREEIARREEEVHKGFTKLDEDRNLGKQIKEVITPYLATIRAEGGTPITAVQDLLNTAHVLRTADPITKARLIQQVMKQYNVDMALLGTQQQVDPQVQTLQQQLAQVRQQIEQQNNLRQQDEDAKLQSTIQAFSESPEHPYYEQVKPKMAALLRSGLAVDLQEAYDQAVKLEPSINQQVIASQAEESARKKQQEIEAKKRAAVSISGSSSNPVANAGNPNRSLREELEAAFRSSSIN